MALLLYTKQYGLDQRGLAKVCRWRKAYKTWKLPSSTYTLVSHCRLHMDSLLADQQPNDFYVYRLMREYMVTFELFCDDLCWLSKLKLQWVLVMFTM